MPLSGAQCNSFCWLLTLIFVAVAVIVAMVISILIDTASHKPSIYKPTFLIDSVLVDPFNISDSQYLTANWNLSITLITKDKRYPLFLEHVRVFVLLKNVVVSYADVETFYFKEMTSKTEEKKFQVNLAASKVAINQSVAEAMNDERIKNGTLTFSFNLSTDFGTLWAGIHTQYWDMTLKHVDVSCEDLKLNFVSNSNTSSSAIFKGEPFKCNTVSSALLN